MLAADSIFLMCLRILSAKSLEYGSSMRTSHFRTISLKRKLWQRIFRFTNIWYGKKTNIYGITNCKYNKISIFLLKNGPKLAYCCFHDIYFYNIWGIFITLFYFSYVRLLQSLAFLFKCLFLVLVMMIIKKLTFTELSHTTTFGIPIPVFEYPTN